MAGRLTLDILDGKIYRPIQFLGVRCLATSNTQRNEGVGRNSIAPTASAKYFKARTVNRSRRHPTPRLEPFSTSKGSRQLRYFLHRTQTSVKKSQSPGARHVRAKKACCAKGGGRSSSDPANGSPPILSQESVPIPNQSIATCVSCQTRDLRRIHRTIWEKAIYRGVYKCLSCGRSRRVARLNAPSAWIDRKVCYVYDRCLSRARLWRPSTPDQSAQPIPWPSRCMDLLREVILELDTQLTRLRAKAQKGVHSGERR